MERVTVTVLINNYNYARYLPAAIDSALNQTYRPLEVVVVDDGSTDESPDIIRDYGDRIRKSLHTASRLPPDRGPDPSADCRGDAPRERWRTTTERPRRTKSAARRSGAMSMTQARSNGRICS